jgi:hypothetical protein
VSAGRTVAAVALLAAVGLCRGVYFHLVSEPLHDPMRAPIDPRYQGLRKLLPPSGEVGYVSDLPVAVRVDQDAGSLGTRLYLHAQYALAPLVLRYDDASAPLVIANLSDPSRLRDLLAQRGLVVVAEAGPGLALLRPKARP